MNSNADANSQFGIGPFSTPRTLVFEFDSAVKFGISHVLLVQHIISQGGGGASHRETANANANGCRTEFN